MRNLKALGIALIAVFAMSAVMASASQGANRHLRCGTGVGTCKIQVETHPQLPTQSFNVPGLGTVECNVFSGTYEGTATPSEGGTLKNVKYEGCSFLGFGATVNFGTCDYFLSAPITEVTATHGTGGVTIGPAGCQVKITVPGCTLVVEGSQEFKTGLTYTDVKTAGKKEEITGHADTGKTVKASYSGFFCGSGSSTEARYQGTFTARATDTSTNPLDLTTVAT